ncbi:PEP-CTERM sorting domain-containing protein [Rubripirellula sp.]|nr:PEP-CTERM sorting domain-containing protein [Rubripirellula sp.]MDB4338993.1 PEP-CTERM sorting domain-containing protein [Rubripirellula sp.]
MFIIRCATLASILISVASSPSRVSAGIVVDQNGILTSATVNDGTNDIDVIFVASSWDGLTSDQRSAIENSSWYTGSSLAGPSNDTYKLAFDLASSLQNSAATLDRNVFYAFSHSLSNFYGTYYDFDTQRSSLGWIADKYQYPTSASTVNTTDNPGNTLYYAIPDTLSSSVPEPSTAIAMGLLGIVGFAGNRRRRRQELVA